MIILVTGASAGFGEAIVRQCVQHHHYVIGLARRGECLATLKSTLATQNLDDYFYPLTIDICDHNAVKIALESLPEQWQTIDVLINNAGLSLGIIPAQQTDFADWQRMIDTNVTALTWLTHLLLPQMVARGTGHIINMGSIAGTYPYPGSNVYGASKAFVAQFSLNLRADLLGTGVRVTNIEPGLCGDTEFSYVRFKGDREKVAQLYRDVDYLTPEDIANNVYWVISQPAHININRLEIMPVAQAFSPLAIHRNKLSVDE